FEQAIDGAARVGATVGVVAEGDDNVIGLRADHVQDAVEGTQTAVDIADGQDAHGVEKPLTSRLLFGENARDPCSRGPWPPTRAHGFQSRAAEGAARRGRRRARPARYSPGLRAPS